MRLPFLFDIEKVIKRRGEKLISPRRKSGLAAASISAATAAIAEKSYVYAAAAGAALVNIIHYFRKLDSVAVYKRNTERSGAGCASFMACCVAYRTDMVAHPAKAAGINVLFSFIR